MRIVLWSIVLLGMLLRIISVCNWSPLAATATDSLRHLSEALRLSEEFQPGTSFVSLVEPLPYALWLAAFLNPSHAEPAAVLCYASFMSVLMPLAWFLWMRNQFRDEFYSLLGLAAFTLMPSFIGIYSFFQPETLLLILLPLSLWLSDSLLARPGAKRAALTGLCWGFTIATRLIVLPLLITTFCWSSFRLGKRGIASGWRLLSIQALVLALVFLIVPIRIFYETGVLEFAPGMVNFNNILYESGAQGVNIHVKFRDRTNTQITEDVPVAAPVRPGMFYRNMMDDQYANWSSVRNGIKDVSVDYTKPEHHRVLQPLSWKERLPLWQENIFMLFCSSSWPENDRPGFLFSLETYMTRIWLPIFVVVVVLACCLRIVTLPTLLFGVLLFALMIQQTSMIEGRYRKPLECLSIVALLDIARLKLPAKKLRAPTRY